MKNIFNKKYLFVVLLLLFISIGYAFLSSTLSISGIGHVKKSKWDVHFENVDVIEGKSFATVAPTTSGRTTTELRYSVKFNSLGDIYKFNVDIVNLGTMNAMVSLIGNTELTEEQQKYADYSITYEDGSSIEEKNFLASNSRDRITVILKYKDDMEIEDLELAEPIDFVLNLEYSLAKEADSRKNTPMIIKDLSGNVNDGIIYGGSYNSDGTFTTDGVNDYINCGLTRYDFQDSISMVIRVKLLSLVLPNPYTDEIALFGNWESAGGGLMLKGEHLTYGFMFGGKYYYNVTESMPTLNQYYTFTGVYDGSMLNVYVNGEKVQTVESFDFKGSNIELANTVTGNVRVSSLPFFLGANPNPSLVAYCPSKIEISSALLFDRALTDEEVASDFAEEINPTNKDNLLFYYNFS